MSKSEQYVPALGFSPLTRFYDVVVGLTTRESTFKNALAAQISCTEKPRLLDVACGTGTLILILADRFPGANIIGLDGDPAILGIAKRKVAGASASIRLDEGLSYELPYENESFDVVTSSLFFHHLSLEAKQRTATEIHRVLRDGGTVHIADWGKPDNVLMSWLFYFVQLLDGFKNTDDNRKGLLPQILKEAGFANVVQDGSFSTIFGTMALYRGEKTPEK